jgi:hypothetical protein
MTRQLLTGNLAALALMMASKDHDDDSQLLTWCLKMFGWCSHKKKRKIGGKDLLVTFSGRQ